LGIAPGCSSGEVKGVTGVVVGGTLVCAGTPVKCVPKG
jgi:hypothetical protein